MENAVMRFSCNCRIPLVLAAAAALFSGCQQTGPSSPPGKGAGQAPSKTSPSAPPSRGVVQNVRQAVKPTADMEDLKNFALAYYQYALEHNRGPSSAQDLKGSVPEKMIDALQDESVYVVIWKVRNPSSETI